MLEQSSLGKEITEMLEQHLQHQSLAIVNLASAITQHIRSTIPKARKEDRTWKSEPGTVIGVLTIEDLGFNSYRSKLLEKWGIE